MLRTVYWEQSTLRCCGRTDKLCVGEVLRGGIRTPRQTRRATNQRDTVGILEESAAPTRNQTLYTLAPTNLTTTVLLLLSSSEFEIVRQGEPDDPVSLVEASPVGVDRQVSMTLGRSDLKSYAV